MTNNSNPYDVDGDQVRSKSRMAGDTARGTVLDVLPEAHAVRVNVRGESAPFIAPVQVSTYGMQVLPQPGSRVTVVYLTDNVPVVTGAVYLQEGTQPPNLEPGTTRLGNETGSRVDIKESGAIQIITTGNKPVDIDVQSASVGLSSPQTIPDGGWVKVEWDVTENNNDNLFRANDYEIEARFGGLYQISASVNFPNPKQNNRYDIAIFVNDTLEKQFTKQSANNIPMSLSVQTDELLDDGDRIDIRVRQDSGSGKNLAGDSTTDEFTVNRTGRRRDSVQ